MRLAFSLAVSGRRATYNTSTRINQSPGIDTFKEHIPPCPALQKLRQHEDCNDERKRVALAIAGVQSLHRCWVESGRVRTGDQGVCLEVNPKALGYQVGLLYWRSVEGEGTRTGDR
jgi:hypothetical protein